MDFDQMTFFRYLPEYFKEEIAEKLDNYIENVLNHDLNANEAPLLLKFAIDYQKWTIHDELKAVLEIILDEPLQSQKDIETASWIYASAILFEQQKLGRQHIGLQLHQIHCIIRLSNVPLIEEFMFVPFRYPVRLSLSVMKCVLHNFEDRCQYVRQSIWYCPKECSGNQNHIFDGELVESRKCSSCQHDLREYECRRTTFNCRFIEVFDASSVETPIEYGKIYRSVKVKLSDELCDEEMILGQIYILTGTYDILTHTYIAWNFQKKFP